ncbi:MAG: TolC family protein [Balneolales bacterium]
MNSRKKIFFTSLLLIMSSVAAAQETNVLTIEEVIQLAEENNQQIESAEYDVRISESAVREAISGYFPQVDVSSQYQNNFELPVLVLPPDSPLGDVIRTGTQHSFSLNTQLSVPIFNQNIIRGVSLSEANEAMSRTMLEITSREIEAEAHRAFISSMLALESYETLRQSITRREQELELVRSMEAEGIVPEYDVIRTQVQVENLRPEVRRAESSYQGSLNYIKLLTGLPIDQSIELAGSLEELYQEDWEPVFNELITGRPEGNFADNPQLLQLDAQRDVFRQQHRLDYAAYYPSLSLTGANNQQGQGSEFTPFDYNWVGSSYVGLSLSIPIFSGFERRYQTQQSQLSLDQLESERGYLVESLNVDYQNAIDQMTVAKETIEAQRLNVQQARRGYEIARVSYERGAQTLIEVIDAELAATDAELNYVQSLHDYIDAVVEIEYILGLNNY